MLYRRLNTTTMNTECASSRNQLKLSTLEALQEQPTRKIQIGILVLPAGIESTCGIMSNILQYLDIKSLLRVKESSLIYQFRNAFRSDDFDRIRDIALDRKYNGPRSINEMIQIHPARRLYLLIEQYQEEFPNGTPFIVACEKGCMEDVQLFVKLHRFHKYVKTNGVNKRGMTLKEMVNQVGRNSSGSRRSRGRSGSDWTPLTIAANNEHSNIVQYLIEQGEADPNITNSIGMNALHYEASYNNTSTGCIQVLLAHMTITSINQKLGGYTPLDYVYDYNHSEVKQEIIALIRSVGGKANYYNANGIRVGDGKGDLNDENDSTSSYNHK